MQGEFSSSSMKPQLHSPIVRKTRQTKFWLPVKYIATGLRLFSDMHANADAPCASARSQLSHLATANSLMPMRYLELSFDKLPNTPSVYDLAAPGLLPS